MSKTASALEKYLGEVREREERATKGPWTPVREDRDDGAICYHLTAYEAPTERGADPTPVHLHADCDDRFAARAHADAAFLCAARTDIPRLLEIVEGLRETGRAYLDAADWAPPKEYKQIEDAFREALSTLPTLPTPDPGEETER